MGDTVPTSKKNPSYFRPVGWLNCYSLRFNRTKLSTIAGSATTVGQLLTNNPTDVWQGVYWHCGEHAIKRICPELCIVAVHTETRSKAIYSQTASIDLRLGVVDMILERIAARRSCRPRRRHSELTKGYIEIPRVCREKIFEHEGFPPPLSEGNFFRLFR